MDENVLLLVFIALAGALGFLIVIRDLICWFFKLNQIAADLRVVADHFRELKKQNQIADDLSFVAEHYRHQRDTSLAQNGARRLQESGAPRTPQREKS